jgi:Ca-activated chloride channel homolog
MKTFAGCLGLVACTALFAMSTAWSSIPPLPGGSATSQTSAPAESGGREVQIDLDTAVPVTLPDFKNDLAALPFKTADGKEGWALRIPGGRPIATPAYADGLLFVGGGYGSHEFYAFDAKTGAVAWKVATGDDGPTAAVVDDGCVAFNTESCTIYVIEARTGKVLWQEWLGDPLMSQPTIAKGRLYMAYPAGQGHAQNGQPAAPAQTAGQSPPPQATTQPAGAALTGSHRLLCAELRTGRHLWVQGLPSDVISAPIVEGDQVLVTCFDGTSLCLDAANGSVVWKKENAGTSAPLVAAGQLVITQKGSQAGNVVEGIRRLEVKDGNAREQHMLAEGQASYLQPNKGGGVALQQKQVAMLDASVGFATAPPAAQLDKANGNVGVNSVIGGWAYQGSRAAYGNGQFMNAQGRFLNCVESGNGGLVWRAAVRGRAVVEGSQVFSPPSLGRERTYLCSAYGHLLSVRQKDGQTAFLYATGQPMAFQPALAEGNVYAGTNNGLLLCLKTGNPDADGWYAWGGNAQHNRKE